MCCSSIENIIFQERMKGGAGYQNNTESFRSPSLNMNSLENI